MKTVTDSDPAVELLEFIHPDLLSAVAISIWNRFAPEYRATFAEELHKEEYLFAAEEVIELVRKDAKDYQAPRIEQSGEREALLEELHKNHKNHQGYWGGLCGRAADMLAADAHKAPSDSDPQAEWLTLAHLICAEAGIAPGHITQRLQILRDRLSEDESTEKTPAAWIDYRALEIARQFTEPKEAQRRAALQCCITAAMKSVKPRELYYPITEFKP